jgi:hypothetical protein
VSGCSRWNFTHGLPETSNCCCHPGIAGGSPAYARASAPVFRKRVRNADEIMAEIVAKRMVEHLDRAGFVVTKRAPRAGGPSLGRGVGA